MIYLNNAATTKQKPPEVFEAVEHFFKELNVSPGRGVDSESAAADKILTDCRASLAKLFNIANPNQIVFTLNCSDALSTALRGVLKAGDHVIISSIEHNSIVRPLRFLEKQGVELSIAQCTNEGLLEPQEIRKFIKKNTKMIACLHASNVIGTILPIYEIGKLAKEEGLLFLLDAAQTAGIYDIDVDLNNIDLLAFAGHKGLMGPQGTGGLYVRDEIGVVPLRHGGTGSSSEMEMQPQSMPDRLETGTPNTPGIAGLKASVDFIIKTGTDKIAAHSKKLTKMLLDGLKSAYGIEIYGPNDAEKQAGVVSFNLENRDQTEVARALEADFGIIVRPGLHCSPLCHRTIDTFPRGTVRISVGYYNTEKDIEAAVEAVKTIALR